ncbi:MAG: hypothetical protein ACRENP_30100 [Longimicrobiales bacterium]
MLRHVLVGTCLLLPARAYAQSPQFLKLNDTLEIEVHALRRWNAQALNDTLMRISPGLSLASHACAAVLRQTLRFADAEVMQVKETGQPTRYAISVIEPQDSALVRHLAAPSSARPPVERWGTALRIITDEFPAMFALSCRFLRAETDSIGQALASAASLHCARRFGATTPPRIWRMRWPRCATTQRPFSASPPSGC